MDAHVKSQFLCKEAAFTNTSFPAKAITETEEVEPLVPRILDPRQEQLDYQIE